MVASRCPAGRVKPVYGGGGGGRDLEDAGAIVALGLSGVKLCLLLMVLSADRLSMNERKQRTAAGCDGCRRRLT